MAGDEDAVPRDDEVGLDEVCAHLDRQLVRRERVLGPVSAGAAVGDDEGHGDGSLPLPAARRSLGLQRVPLDFRRARSSSSAFRPTSRASPSASGACRPSSSRCCRPPCEAARSPAASANPSAAPARPSAAAAVPLAASARLPSRALELERMPLELRRPALELARVRLDLRPRRLKVYRGWIGSVRIRMRPSVTLTMAPSSRACRLWDKTR